MRILSSCSNLNRSPYSVVWNVQMERQLPAHLTLRLGYLFSRSHDLSVIGPGSQLAAAPFFLLSNTGNSRYYEVESTLIYRPSRRIDLTASYIHSHTRGDLNTLSEISIPFEQPVVRPNTYASTPADVPDRVISWGIFSLPWQITLSPVLDYHTGFNYSNIDVLQNYVGTPNSLRLPNFFSVDLRAYKDIHIPVSVFKKMKEHQFRLGIYVSNLTNHSNPHDVYNNIASPHFGQFAGFQHRFYGMIVDIVQ